MEYLTTGTQTTGQVTRHDGSPVPLDTQKIRQAITVVGQATDEFDTIEVQYLTSGIVAYPALLPCPGIETI